MLEAPTVSRRSRRVPIRSTNHSTVQLNNDFWSFIVFREAAWTLKALGKVGHEHSQNLRSRDHSRNIVDQIPENRIDAFLSILEIG